MEVSNSNISNLFACLSNINDKFENKIVKVQETVSHQIEDFSSTVDNKINNKFDNEVTEQLQGKIDKKFNENLDSAISSKLESNFDSIIDSKINDNNQIINKSISDINNLLNFGSNTSKVYSKDEVNEKFLDKPTIENKFKTIYSKEDTNKLLDQKLNSEIINNYFDKSTIENKFKTVYSKEDTDNLLAKKLNSGVINNYLDKSSAETKFNELNSKISTTDNKFKTVYSKDETNDLLAKKLNSEAINNYFDKSAIENKFKTVYSKEDTDNLLAKKLDSGVINNYFDKSTIENKLSSKADIETIYSKDETDNLLDQKLDSGVINNYFDKSTVETKFNELNTKISTTDDKFTTVYSKDEVNEKFLDKSSADNKFTTVYSKEDINTLLENNYLNKTLIETKFEEMNSEMSTINSLITNNKNELEAKINSIPIIENIYYREEIDDKLKLKVDTSVLDNYLDSNSISTELQKYCLKTNLNTDISELQKIKDIEGLITSNKSEIDSHETSITKFSNILNFENDSVSKVYSKDQINSLLTNNYLNKSEVQSIQTNLSGEINKLKEILDFNNASSKVYSKEVIDNKLLSKANSEDVYTITSTNELLKNKLDISEINNYPNKTEVDAIKTELSNQIQAINSILDFENENSQVYSKKQVNNLINKNINSLFDSEKNLLDTISVEAYLVKAQVASIGSIQTTVFRDLYSKSIVKIYGNLRINKQLKDNNNSEVETVVGKGGGAAGIVSLGVNLRYYYSLSGMTECTDFVDLGTLPLNFHVISIVPGASSTSEVIIYFEGYKFGKFITVNTSPTKAYLNLDFQYYSANFSTGIYKWFIDNCYLEIYKI